MDKILYRKILRSRRSLAVVAGMKKRTTTLNRQKSNAKENGHINIVVSALSVVLDCGSPFNK